MTQPQKLALFLTRISLGWLFFYSGIIKVMGPQWSAAGFLKGAKTFAAFYQWLAQPAIIPAVNFVNAWGLTLLGVSLILGVFVRFSSVLGALLMLLYYFPNLVFPYPNTNAYIVDQHIIYIFVLLFFSAVRAGRTWGLDSLLKNHAGLPRWLA